MSNLMRVGHRQLRRPSMFPHTSPLQSIPIHPPSPGCLPVELLWSTKEEPCNVRVVVQWS